MPPALESQQNRCRRGSSRHHPARRSGGCLSARRCCCCWRWNANILAIFQLYRHNLGTQRPAHSTKKALSRPSERPAGSYFGTLSVSFGIRIRRAAAATLPQNNLGPPQIGAFHWQFTVNVRRPAPLSFQMRSSSQRSCLICRPVINCIQTSPSTFIQGCVRFCLSRNLPQQNK